MKKNHINKVILFSIIGIVLLYVALQFLGTEFYRNGWSFDHWQYLHFWYLISWIIISIVIAIIFIWNYQIIAKLLQSKMSSLIGLSVIAIVLFIAQYDSFLYGGGNLRAA